MWLSPKYLGTTLTDKNCIHEEIKSRLNFGNACYHSVQSPLSSYLLSRIVKVNPASCLYGCETWSLTVREEYSLRVVENSALSRIFGPERGMK
jgi:hypothetical protein